tara:strand:- start:1011 stop:2282 length:1272 start_codon:yes stop_codon:yes gene_type:complete
MCGCGCNTCEIKGPILTESRIKKVVSENLQYHIDKNIPLMENVFRIGSDAHLSIIKEARRLYSRGVLDLCEEDKDIIETHLGEFGMYEGEKVPLDLPMLSNVNFNESIKTPNPTSHADLTEQVAGIGDDIEVLNKLLDVLIDIRRNSEKTNDELEALDQSIDYLSGAFLEKNPLAIDVSQDLLGRFITPKLKKDLKERYKLVKEDEERYTGGSPEVRYELKNLFWENIVYFFGNEQIGFPNPSDEINVIQSEEQFNRWKDKTLKDYPNIIVSVLPQNKGRYDRIEIKSGLTDDNENFKKDQEDYSEGKARALKFMSIDENEQLDEKKKAKKKKKDPPIGKPKRGGPKAYYVYVRDPKTKRIKKVTFGSGGLRAKIRNPKARKAFAARHKCSQKNDRTKASYWSCRLPRYAKQLGLGANMNTFW